MNLTVYKPGETADFEFIFLDAVTNEPVDIINAQYTIVYYVSNVEQVIIPASSLTRVENGTYVASWKIPLSASLDTYFVRATGLHPVWMTDTVLEEAFKVVPRDYFGGGSQHGLVIKFTKD